MSNEQDKYNDYDTDDNFANGISHSRRRRAAARRNGTSVSARKSTPKPAKVLINMAKQYEDEPDELPENIEYEDINEDTDNEGAEFNEEESMEEPKRKKKRTPLKTFLTVLLSILGVYIIGIGIFAISTYFNDDPTDDWNVQKEEPLEKITEVFSPKLPDRTQFVIMCTDEDGTRTDTIMVGCYNSVTQGISLISVPRDTIISASADNYTKMREEFPEPGKRTMKINAVHHYAGPELGPEMLVDELNSLLGTDIQYYVRVNFDAFHYMIDSIGGIEYDVPQDMDYDDPTQDLAIHLKKGVQMLDGDKAEQLVRYRHDNYGHGYFNGDLGRIEVQQSFMKTLIKKLASADTIKQNPKAYITTFFKYVTTNASLTDAIKYSSALDKIDTNKVETYTLPGDVAYIAGISGYAADEDAVKNLVYDIFEKPVDEIVAEQNGTSPENGEGAADSKSASIKVLNGSYTNGMAGKVENKIEAEGYNVKDVGTSFDEKKEETVIYVNKDGLGDDLKQYFNDAEVVVDPDTTGDYDIVIVVGTSESE